MPRHRNTGEPHNPSVGTLLVAAGVTFVLALAPAGRALADQLQDAFAAYLAETREALPEAEPLDPAVLDAMVAALPKHSVPLTASTADGVTFSGVDRTIQSGAVDLFEQTPYVQDIAAPLSGHDLFWTRLEQDSAFGCDPTQPLHTIVERVQDTAAIRYSIDASGTPGDIKAVNFVVPSTFASSGYPVDSLNVSVTVTTAAGTVSGVGVAAAPPPGATLNYLVDFGAAPLAVDATAQIVVEVTGDGVQPTVGAPTTWDDPSCPGQSLTQRRGSTQILLIASFVTIFIEEAAQAALAITPSSVTTTPLQPQTFEAFECPLDADGNPDVGPDGVPGTSDDLCVAAANVTWSTSGAIGRLSSTSGPQTTLDPAVGSGQVVASDGDRSAASDVTVLPPAFHILPGSIRLASGESVTLAGWNCPRDANGNPDAGPDGVPGTSDDLCEPANARFDVQGPVGALSSATGGETTLTAANVAPGETASGAVVATDAYGSDTLATVDVAGPPAAVAYRDANDDAVDTVLLFEPAPGIETAIRVRQAQARTFAALADALSGLPGRLGRFLAALFGGLADDAAAQVAALVPADARYTVTAPDAGAGDLTATLQSLDENGDVVETFEIVLSPDGSGNVRSGALVPVLAGGRIDGGATGSIAFVPARPGGTLVTRADGLADAIAAVAGTETHRIDLEVERMFRHGLPLAEDAPAGATQIVVRATTAHELMQSLDRLAAGASLLPFDGRASLLGELAGSERTVVGVFPTDLAALRRAILDDIAADGRDPSDPGAVARFLRRNPDRGRVTLALDAGIDRGLSTAEGAYAGDLDAGFIEFREDLLLREAQRERVIRDRGRDRRIRVVVTLVENGEVTNVLPYADATSARDARRLRRSPSDGGIFQGAGDPRAAQLIAVARGGGDRGRTDARSYATVNAAGVGEDGERAAHALAHVVGHLLFGRRHDGRSPLFIMHRDPSDDDAFYAASFDDFVYSERTVRRGARHLDLHWEVAQ